MEDILKNIVLKALEVKLGMKVTISHSEWESAKSDTLKDLYANNFCFFKDVSSEYFINIMVSVLAVRKAIVA